MHNNKTLVVTPSNVNGLITRLLKQDARLMNLSVRGEITNLKISSAGHCFFSLSDGVSKLSAAVWRNNFERLKITLEDGLGVICRGSISTYESAGTYNLVCSDIEIEGEGEQSKALDELVKKLKAEGVFDRKRPLPEFPKTIAVVTSPTGAVVHDIEKTLGNRFPCVKMLVIPAVVQGESAPDSIAYGIEYAQKTDADVIIFGRGGGASEDLSAFNTEKVARAVFASRIPTISAVGHDIDITIADLAADRTAATPTAAAVAAVPDKEELHRKLDMVRAALSDRMNAKITRMRGELDTVKARADELLTRCYKTKENELCNSAQSIKRLMERKLEIYTAELEKNRELISALNPLSTLKRGYSIVRLGEKTITGADGLSVGDNVEIRFGNGSAAAVIKEIRK
ncbi:MAG: exodeoxyribonuclease VII large subunit [Oscillospiraceae bacterium]|nr:exodeoxyribonuclease VII large subunit [Oscillospiraceae bacterium]